MKQNKKNREQNYNVKLYEAKQRASTLVGDGRGGGGEFSRAELTGKVKRPNSGANNVEGQQCKIERATSCGLPNLQGRK